MAIDGGGGESRPTKKCGNCTNQDAEGKTALRLATARVSLLPIADVSWV